MEKNEDPPIPDINMFQAIPSRKTFDPREGRS